MPRSSWLGPLPIDEQVKLALQIIMFFSPQRNNILRQELDLPTTPGAIHPLKVAEFYEYLTKAGREGWSLHSQVSAMIRKMVAEGFLEPAGGSAFNESFWTTKEFTNRQTKGYLFLTSILGPEFLAQHIRKAIAHITGKDEQGDLGAGTGILISDDVILTCKHVVEDMQIDSTVEISGSAYRVHSTAFHQDVDVAVIHLHEKVPHFLKDIAFRPAQLLEGVMIAGYPAVPYGTTTYLTYQKGEICAQSVSTMGKSTVDLFTAIARPGNSGGPVLAFDGRIVGIVTQSLEHGPGGAGQFQVPFFAAVPAETIRRAVSELSGGKTILPFEDYDRGDRYE